MSVSLAVDNFTHRSFCILTFKFFCVKMANCTTCIWWRFRSILDIQHTTLLQWFNTFLMQYFQIGNAKFLVLSSTAWTRWQDGILMLWLELTRSPTSIWCKFDACLIKSTSLSRIVVIRCMMDYFTRLFTISAFIYVVNQYTVGNEKKLKNMNWWVHFELSILWMLRHCCLLLV